MPDKMPEIRELRFTLADADFYDVIDLTAIHRKLKKQLELVENAIEHRRDSKDFHDSWNPEWPEEHLLTCPCYCQWCTNRIRGTLNWKRYKKAL